MNRKGVLAPGVMLAAVVGILLSTTQNSFAFLLVQNGQPRATIVVPQDANLRVQRAAEVLQQYIQQSSGTKLPIATTADGNAIHVGQTITAKKAAINTAALGQDGFILQGIDARNYAIVGGSDWGTEYGVYEFLERYLGVRWLMPTELGTDVPLHSTIDVPTTRIVQNPMYISRQFGPVYIEGKPTPNALGWWGRFNRVQTNRFLFGENLLNLFPVSEFGKTHPEFYPMLNGKRYIPTSDTDYSWQPNLSNSATIDVAVAKIEKFFQENPEANSFSLGMNDADAWDQSAASKARRSGKRNFLGYEDVSDEYFAWANAVVERVLLKYPDKWFGTLAYMNLSEPPTKVKVHPRIVPYITYDRMRWEDPKLRAVGHEITERWAKAASVVGWYDYAYGLNYLLPRVYPHRMQEYLSWGAAHQVKYSYAELYPNWGEGPKPWIFTKLLWNPNQDVDALLDDWYTHFAGVEAAPSLQRFYAIWEKFWMVDIFNSKSNHDEGELLFFSGDPKYLLDVPASYIAQSDSAMADAFRLADTPQRKARVAKLKEMWEFYKASIITYQGEHFAAQADLKSAAQAIALLDKAEDVMAQAHKRQELLAAFEKDPLFAETARYLTRYPATNGQNWGNSLLWRALPWVEKSSQVKERLQQLAQNPVGAARDQANMVLQTAAGKATLISANASFEEGIKGWTFWDKSSESNTYHKADWIISTDRAHSGKQSLLIKGLQRGAPYQILPYQAGTFFAQANCYIPQGSKIGTLRMTLHVLGAKRETRSGRFALPSSAIPLQPGVWQTIVLPFTLPPDSSGEAASIRVMVELDNFEPDGEIYLDDVGLYKVEE
jgi:hypothetical protein